jgi:hypothetical protein
MEKRPELAKPDYSKYADLEMHTPGVWAQILRQLSHFQARELSLVLIAIVALAILYKRDLSDSIQALIFATMFGLGIVDNLKREFNATSRSKATEGQIKLGHARRNQRPA